MVWLVLMIERDGSAERATGHRAKPACCGSTDSPYCRTGGELPGRYISPPRLRDKLPGETQEEALRLRTGWRPLRAQNVCTQWVVAWISACGWGTAPPRRHNRIRLWLVQPRRVRACFFRPRR